MSKKCAFGCVSYKTIHRFPRFKDRFEMWVKLAGGQLKTAEDRTYWYGKRMCNRHFTKEDMNRNKRLNNLAIPSLHLTVTKLPKIQEPSKGEGAECTKDAEADCTNEVAANSTCKEVPEQTKTNEQYNPFVGDPEVATEVEIIQDWTKEVAVKDMPANLMPGTTIELEDEDQMNLEEYDNFTNRIRAEQMLAQLETGRSRPASPRRVRERQRMQENPLAVDVAAESERERTISTDADLMPKPFEELKDEFTDVEYLDLNMDSDGHSSDEDSAHIAETNHKRMTKEGPRASHVSSVLKEIGDLKWKALECRKRAKELQRKAADYEKRAATLSEQSSCNAKRMKTRSQVAPSV